MSQVTFLSKSRGILNLFSRISTIISRFGVSPRKYENLLREYGKITNALGCIPTFPITAVTLKRHPDVVRELSQKGVDFAVHGFIHTDYGVLPMEAQLKHFREAIDTFNKCNIPYTGFRAPFVRTNDETFKALSEVGFLYDSSHVVHWDVLDVKKYPDGSWQEYERILDFYASQKAEYHLVLPTSIDGFIEIPMSMPDDEAMVERLGITAHQEIVEIWLEILEKSYNSGELFTLQLHPERIELCQGALKAIVQRARQLKPTVWITTLKEIAEWWRERGNFGLKITSLNDGKFNVKANCTDRATVLCKNCKVNAPVESWCENYQRVNTPDFTIESPIRPVIGVQEDANMAAVDFLRREGYIVEINSKPQECGIYLDNLRDFTNNDEKNLSLEIERMNSPVVRYWRWPDGNRSALSVTGDIDSITLFDFALRIIENFQQRSRKIT